MELDVVRGERACMWYKISGSGNTMRCAKGIAKNRIWFVLPMMPRQFFMPVFFSACVYVGKVR